MNSKQVHAINSLLSLFLILLVSFAAAPVAAQDAVTVQPVNASANTVDVPVYIRDVSGTPSAAINRLTRRSSPSPSR